MTTKREFDLWGVPFDGEATLGWPGARHAPAKVRECAKWINMRIQDGKIYSLEKNAILEVGNSLLTDRGDVNVIPSDTLKTFAYTSEAVAGSIRDKRVPIVIGGDDSGRKER